MSKSKFLNYNNNNKTKNDSILEDFGWYEQEISLNYIISLAKEKNISLDELNIKLSYMDDPYNENPHLLLVIRK